MINFFIKTLLALHNAGALKELILIGSWCNHFYKIYFNNAPEIPIVRTLDIDFLVPNPVKIQEEINIPEILKNLDFIPLHSYITGLTKFVHPELELEFLTPELGRGKGIEPYKIPPLHINAQGLRYLDLLQSYTIEIKYLNMVIRVPEPAAYILHKFIICKICNKEEKRERDLYTVREISNFLLGLETQKEKIFTIFYSLPLKWQRKILKNTKIYHKPFYDFLLQNKECQGDGSC